jgi:hypothetical protein
MSITLPLDKMTIAEKLEVMESLWRDLSRDESCLESPVWHGEILRQREQQVADGKEAYVTWDEAKQELRDRLL